MSCYLIEFFIAIVFVSTEKLIFKGVSTIGVSSISPPLT
jgi:hypothetical protein